VNQSSTKWRVPQARPGCRAPLAFWDRVKFLVLLAVLIAWVTATKTNTNPLEPVAVALASTLRADWWLTVLVVLEVVRQLNYLALERLPAWNATWEEVVVIPLARIGRSRDDWTRYRIARAGKVVLVLALISVVLAAHYHVSPFLALFVVPGMIMNSLPTIIEVAVYLLIGVGSFVAIFWYLSKGGYEVYFPGDVKTRFSDVWGQDAVLERIKENLIFLTDPERIEEKGGYVPTGILLWGPPGTGKTLIAEAVAGETQVPFVFVEPGAFANMFIGVGILKVKSIFRRLRKLSVRYGGVVAFFDEADSLGSRGALAGADGRFRLSGSPIFGSGPTCHGGHYFDPLTQQILFEEELRRHRSSSEDGAGRRSIWRYVVPGFGGMDGTLQALLTELSGLQKPRGFWNRVVRRALGLKPKEPPKYRILTILATNLPDVLDEALLRPGRIDRIYKVGYPSKEGRVRTFQGYLSKVRHSLTDEDIDRLATMTPYLSGAAIKDMVNEALIIAIRDGREVIEWADMIRAKQIKTFGLPEDVEYVERERHAVAVHEACHAVVAVVVRRNSVIDIATIEKGSNFLGLVSYLPKEERFTRWRSEFEADIMVGLASLAGERAFFGGDNTSGVAGDLYSASRLAALMDTSWGMGDTILQLDAVRDLGVAGASPQRRRVGPQDDGRAKASIGDRVERRLQELYERVERIVEEHRYDILAVAHALETTKTITGDDIIAIMERRPGLLVDGSVYAEPGMRAQIEAYHEAVAKAHRLQESKPMTVPLPAGRALGSGSVFDRREAAMRHEHSTGEGDQGGGNGTHGD